MSCRGLTRSCRCRNCWFPQVGSWADPKFKQAFVERVFGIVEEHAPGFRDSVVGFDALSPLDLERVFGLHKGNIFHGAISLHQLAYLRPAPGLATHRTPLKGLYLVRGAPSAGCCISERQVRASAPPTGNLSQLGFTL